MLDSVLFITVIGRTLRVAVEWLKILVLLADKFGKVV